MTPTSTGYEDSGPPPEDGPVEFGLESYSYQWSSSILGRVTRNGVAIGILYFKTKEELEWMKERVRGTFDGEIHQMKIRDKEPKDYGHDLPFEREP